MSRTSIGKLAPVALAALLSTVPRPARAVGTAFTYQGQLQQNGTTRNGTCDFQFTLFDAPTDGNQVGTPVPKSDVTLKNGFFTVELDFGAVFTGANVWLLVESRCPAGSGGGFIALLPRQSVTAVPLALVANGVPAGSITSESFAPGAALPPSGPAGGDLAGTYPNPTLAPNAVNATELASDRSSLGRVTNNAMAVDSNGNVGVGGQFGARLEAFNSSGIGLMGTSDSRGVVGRLGNIACPGGAGNGTYAVGGCAGTSGGTGVQGLSGTGVGVFGRAEAGRAVVGFSDTGIGVLGNANARGVIGTLGGTSCAGTYAVGACGATIGDGVSARTSAAGATAVRAINDAGGNIFVGIGFGATQARIDASGKGFFNGGTQTGGADYADSMRTTDAPATLVPGDVLAIDPRHGNALRQSTEPNSRLVAGVYSTKPAMLGVGDHAADDLRVGEVPVALVGVVPTKVTAENGPIQIGDLLVTSSTPGRAMKARPDTVNGVVVYPSGAILGKALEPLPEGNGTIQVLLTLR